MYIYKIVRGGQFSIGVRHIISDSSFSIQVNLSLPTHAARSAPRSRDHIAGLTPPAPPTESYICTLNTRLCASFDWKTRSALCIHSAYQISSCCATPLFVPRRTRTTQVMATPTPDKHPLCPHRKNDQSHTHICPPTGPPVRYRCRYRSRSRFPTAHRQPMDGHGRVCPMGTRKSLHPPHSTQYPATSRPAQHHVQCGTLYTAMKPR